MCHPLISWKSINIDHYFLERATTLSLSLLSFSSILYYIKGWLRLDGERNSLTCFKLLSLVHQNEKHE
uniref:Ovule protein n=1 Tax=Strongyloides papillosus TaxID=174720 RepID=A0A0N5BTD1_STREA